MYSGLSRVFLVILISLGALAGILWIHSSAMSELEEETFNTGRLAHKVTHQSEPSDDHVNLPKTSAHAQSSSLTSGPKLKGTNQVPTTDRKVQKVNPFNPEEISNLDRGKVIQHLTAHQGESPPNNISKHQHQKDLKVIPAIPGVTPGVNETSGEQQLEGLNQDLSDASSTSSQKTTDHELEEDSTEEPQEEEGDLGLYSFSGTLYSSSSQSAPFVNLYKSDRDSNEFFNDLNQGRKDLIFQNSVFIGSSDEQGKVSFQLSGSDNAIILIGEYAGVIRILFDNKVSEATAWNNSFITMEDIDNIYTVRGKVTDEDDKPIRYAEILIDEALLNAEYEDKQAGSYAKTDKFGKYIFNLKVEEFPLQVICHVKDRSPEKKELFYTNSSSLFLDAVDFKIPKDRYDAAIRKGLEWLIQQQDKRSGAFGRKHPQVSTALSSLALIAQGHITQRSAYHENFIHGLKYLCLKDKNHTNYYYKEGRMYSHALVSLTLSEALGVLPQEKDNNMIKGVLEKAIDHIVNSQVKDESSEFFGGWRYTPTSKDADLSVSALQILALHSARNNGLEVPLQTLDHASKFVRGMYSNTTKSFTYMTSKQASPAMRAAGVVAMNVLKLNHSSDDLNKIINSASFLLNYIPKERSKHFWYTNYYAFTAASIMGGKYDDFVLTLKNEMIKKQNDNGSFEGDSKYGNVYSTAFALISFGAPIVH